MLTAKQLNLRTLDAPRYWTYALIDPRNDEIRYIGRSLNPRKRLGEHMYPQESQSKRDWIGELRKLGLQPQVSAIESAETETTAIDSEQYWIKRCLELGANLLNDPRFIRTNGGRPRKDVGK